AKSVTELEDQREKLKEIYRETLENLPSADPKTLVITRRISRLTYAHRCIEGAAVQAYQQQGVSIAPGMKIQYVVTDARRYQVKPAWCADSFDPVFYRGLIDKAWAEIAYAFTLGDTNTTMSESRPKKNIFDIVTA